MQKLLLTPVTATTYGSESYDRLNYNGTNTTTSGSGSAGGSRALTNTGIVIASVVTLAAVVLLVAMVVRIWKRPSKRARADD